MISAIESVTLGVSDLDAALRLYRDALGMRVEFDTRASVNLLGAWKLPVTADVRLVTLSCDGYPYGRIRLAHYPEADPRRTRDDFGPDARDRPTDVGPKALDLYTGAPIRAGLDALAAAGATLRCPPVRFEIGANDTEEAMLGGPDGAALLVMVGHRHAPGSRRIQPQAGRFSEVATVSIVTGDLDASRRFYEEALGYVHESTDTEVRGEHREAAARLFGLPQGTRVHFALYRERRSPSGKVVLVHFYDRTTQRLANPMRPGQLGMNLITCRCTSLESVAQRLGRAGGYVESVIAHVAVDVGVPCRVMLVRGPNGELFEFVER